MESSRWRSVLSKSRGATPHSATRGLHHTHCRHPLPAAMALVRSDTGAWRPRFEGPSGNRATAIPVAMVRSPALVTAVASSRPRKSNSERGKAFRARRKQEERELLALVGSLRREVSDLGVLHSLRRELSLRRRDDQHGSLARTALQYFDEFACGAADGALVPGRKRVADAELQARRQEDFLRSVMDPDMQFGSLAGWQPLLEQWRRYTAFHTSIDVVVTGFEVLGPEESPTVLVRSDLRVVFSKDTLANVFPHAADDEELVRKFIGRKVIYKGVNRLRFSEDGRVVGYDADVGFVDALTAAGFSVQDLARLMNDARIVDQCQLGDESDRVVQLEEEESSDNNQSQDESTENNQYEDESSDSSQYEDEREDEAAAGEPEPPAASEQCELPAPTKRSRFDLEFLLS